MWVLRHTVYCLSLAFVLQDFNKRNKGNDRDETVMPLGPSYSIVLG